MTQKLEFRKAVRRAVPLMIALASPSGGGKTYSALLLARGLAGPKGRVALLDTENGRGLMYADAPEIVAAHPDGYEYLEMVAPFSPKRYQEHIVAAEGSGINVLIIDSFSHEWEGIGGCQDLADKNRLKGMPNWALAKREHKLLLYHCLSARMHIIFCLRARDKVKISDDNKVIQLGIQPICEKNFPFEMTISVQLEVGSNHAKPVKVPQPLAHLVRGDSVLSIALGQKISEWNDGGAPLSAWEQLLKRASLAAAGGIEQYRKFCDSLPTKEANALKASEDHQRFKFEAEESDKEAAAIAAEGGGQE